MQFSDAVEVLVFLAVAVVVVRWPRIWRFLRFPGSSNWPTYPATVEDVVVRAYSGRAGTTYSAELSYSYEVNGEYYSGYYKGDSVTSEAEAGELVALYPKGTRLTVRVNPERSSESVLSLAEA